MSEHTEGGTRFHHGEEQAVISSGLLQVVQKIYSEILSLNLTKGTYHFIQYDNTTPKDTPSFGDLKDMESIRLSAVYIDDVSEFFNRLSVKSLRESFIKKGKSSVKLIYRRTTEANKPLWYETTVMRQHDHPEGDVILIAVSRIIDEYKAEGLKLETELRVQTDELRHILSDIGKHIFFYDAVSGTLSVPYSFAKKKCIPAIINDFPESFLTNSPELLTAETKNAITDFYAAVRRGEREGSCILHFPYDKDGERWERMEFSSLFDESGALVNTLIFLEDITDEQKKAQENTHLKSNEQILRLFASHSERTISYYDIKTGRTVEWSPDGKESTPLNSLTKNNKYLIPESKQAINTMFDNIYSGSKKGVANLCIKKSPEEKFWYEIKYSTIFDKDGMPKSVLFSHKDITRRYERDIAYKRHLSSMEAGRDKHLLIIEADLSTNTVDVFSGSLAKGVAKEKHLKYSDIVERTCNESYLLDKYEEAKEFFSYNNLLKKYSDGKCSLKEDFPIVTSKGSEYWIRTEITLLEDSYTGHIKAFMHAYDITMEKTEELEIKNRSERDGMTGLLNRATAEYAIAEATENGGIFLLIDLDGLKTINDTFGHEHGDKAIKGIAGELQAHFRKDDITGRLGGDEFVAFLPGAHKDKSSISLSLAALLREIAAITVGPENEHRIHCSIGATICEGNTPFSQLYKEADLALYHVKRSGKNNFAFYDEEMKNADYKFKRQKLLSDSSHVQSDFEDHKYLLHAIAAYYPIVLSQNLTANSYLLLESESTTFENLPGCGSIESITEHMCTAVQNSDRDTVYKDLSREALLEAFKRGERSVRRYVRLCDGAWAEVTVIFYTHTDGDICAFTLLRRSSEREKELDSLWLHKLLDLTVVTVFEYICIVDIESGDYYMYGNDGKNTHALPEKASFEEATREIRDTLITPEGQSEYYEKASLTRILSEMKDKDSYAYTYSLSDGNREAAFYWFEPDKKQLLMTVRKINEN